MVSSGTRSRSAGERVRLFSATWAGVKWPAGPAVQQLPVRGVGRAGRVELGPAAKTGVAQALRLQLGQLGAVEGKALALVVRGVGAAFLPTLVPEKAQGVQIPPGLQNVLPAGCAPGLNPRCAG